MCGLYQIGDGVEITGGEFAGLGGWVVATSPGGCEVLVGGYRLPVAEADLAPDLLSAVKAALAELRRLDGADARVVARVAAAVRAATQPLPAAMHGSND